MPHIPEPRPPALDDDPRPPARAGWTARHPLTRLVLIVIAALAALTVVLFIGANLYVQ
ncbi:hypothetical protein ACVU7I_06135 [Patulibacter sp. S7RM1-6]